MINIPSLDEIAGMSQVRLYDELRKLRNEISFIVGDRAHGGPSRGDLYMTLAVTAAAITEKLANG